MEKDLQASVHNSTKRAFTRMQLMAKSLGHKTLLPFLFRYMPHLPTENIHSLNSRENRQKDYAF